MLFASENAQQPSSSSSSSDEDDDDDDDDDRYGTSLMVGTLLVNWPPPKKD